MQFRKNLKLLKEVLKLEVLKIKFTNYKSNEIDSYREMYNHFTKAHSRLKIIPNKSIGVALIKMDLFKNFEDYYKKINGKNSAAYYSRKCLGRGYIFREIDRNDYIDDIYEINTSSDERQGRKMSKDYLKKIESYDNVSNFRYFGVVNGEGKLVSYCNIGFYGEFVSINTLLGHSKFLNDGIMYLMLIEVFKIIFQDYIEKDYKYIMYDTFFGASEGLKLFKTKLLFVPYRVKWQWA